MAMVKVIYVNNTAGEVRDSRLEELIVRGRVTAFCGPDGWVNVNALRALAVEAERGDKVMKMGNEY